MIVKYIIKIEKVKYLRSLAEVRVLLIPWDRVSNKSVSFRYPKLALNDLLSGFMKSLA